MNTFSSIFEAQVDQRAHIDCMLCGLRTFWRVLKVIEDTVMNNHPPTHQRLVLAAFFDQESFLIRVYEDVCSAFEMAYKKPINIERLSVFCKQISPTPLDSHPPTLPCGAPPRGERRRALFIFWDFKLVCFNADVNAFKQILCKISFAILTCIAFCGGGGGRA